MENNTNRLKDFAKNVEPVNFSRTPTNGVSSYNRYGFRMNNPVHPDFDLPHIEDLIRNGRPEELRELSRHFYRISGIYRNVIDLSANLSKYDTIVIPILNPNKTAPKSQLIKKFYDACQFVDSLHVPQNFAKISRTIYINGIYYGILRDEDGLTIQDLPMEYCRSRFKDGNDLDVLEFNLLYFQSIKDEKVRDEAVATYPDIVQKAWKKYVNKNSVDIANGYWIEIPPEEGGIVFTYGDRTPPFISAIPSIYQLNDAVKREAERDENELYKILVQRMPITTRGELVFQTDEVEEIHAGVSRMLENTDTVDVLTTFGEVSLESLQDSTSATQSTTKIEKYVDDAYDELGISQLLFNSDTASGLDYAVKKHEALIKEITNLYSIWIKYQINERFGGAKFSYDFEILPTPIFNQSETQEKYFQGAQYGYSKMYAGVSLGIKQISQLSLMDFENDYLGLTEKMIPLQSSYTASSKSNTSSEALSRKASASSSATSSSSEKTSSESEKTSSETTDTSKKE